MPTATFETPDGDEIQVDASDVVDLAAGKAPGTTIIDLDDGEEIIVVATRRETVAALDLNPLDFVDLIDEDESEVLVDDGDEDEIY